MTPTNFSLRAGGSVSMRPLEQVDLEDVRVWRNDQMAVLRQSQPLTTQEQELWWRTVYQPGASAANPRQLLFVMREAERRVAYGGFTNIEWNVRRAELSFLAATAIAAAPDEYELTQRRFLAFLLDFGFGPLGLTRLFSETYAFRTRHIQTLEAAGLRPEGRLRSHGWAQDGPVDALVHGALAGDTPLPDQWTTR